MDALNIHGNMLIDSFQSTIYFQPPMKKGARVQTKSKAAPKKKILPKRKKGRSSDKDAHKAKRSATEMKCPECNVVPYEICRCLHEASQRATFYTTPRLAGLVFRSCGAGAKSNWHGRECKHSNFTVICRRHGPIRRLNNAKTTPKCVLCEAYPNTVNGYVSHLRIHHKSTLKKNGVYLLCSCGFELEYRDGQGTKSYHMQWKKGCDGREFALKKKVANEESEDEE